MNFVGPSRYEHFSRIWFGLLERRTYLPIAFCKLFLSFGRMQFCKVLCNHVKVLPKAFPICYLAYSRYDIYSHLPNKSFETFSN